MGNRFTEGMVQKATEHVRKANSATATGIGRALGIGYSDSAAMLKELEDQGVVVRSFPGSREFIVVPGGELSSSVEIGPFTILLAPNGWCVREGDQIVKYGIPTLEGAVNVAEFLIGKEGKH